MRTFFFLALSFLAAGTLAATPVFRADICGTRKEGTVKLSPAKGKADSFESANITWGKEEERPFNLSGYGAPLKADAWVEQTFSFRAEETGKVSLMLGGQWAKNAKDREWVLLAGLTVNGQAVPNADFSQVYMDRDRQIPTHFWLHDRGRLVPGAGPAGKNAVLVNHDNRLYYALDVEAGSTYTVTLQVKPVPAQ